MVTLFRSSIQKCIKWCIGASAMHCHAPFLCVKYILCILFHAMCFETLSCRIFFSANSRLTEKVRFIRSVIHEC